MTAPKLLTEAKLRKLAGAQWYWLAAADSSAVLLYEKEASIFHVYKADFAAQLAGVQQWEYIATHSDLTALATIAKPFGLRLEALAEEFASITEAARAGRLARAESGECTNPFLQPDGFCTICGKKHAKETRAQREKKLLLKTHTDMLRGMRKTMKRSAMLEKIASNAVWQRAFDTADQVLSDWSLDAAISFRSMASLCFSTLQPRTDQLLLSFSFLQHAAANGFEEMARLTSFVKQRTLYGEEAAHQIALHCCAHLIATTLGETQPRARHGDTFKEVYSMLVNHYPFIQASSAAARHGASQLALAEDESGAEEDDQLTAGAFE